jgi:general secretion pathway protein L
MPEILVVRLHSAADAAAREPAEWLTIDSSGARRGNVQSGTVADAVAHAAGRRLIVLVPGTDALLAEPVLPLKSGAKLAQVVPFALEEHLAADVEDLHFAVGKREGRPGTPVTVVAHARMDAWLAAFAEAGAQPDAIYPETAALPETPNGVTLLVDGARVYVRRESVPGAVLEVEPLIEALQLALASGEESREHVTIFVTEEDYERERELLEGLREFTASLQLKLLPDGPLPLLAGNVARTHAVNLLQGRYQPKRKIQVSFAPWRYAAILAVAFFAMHLGLKGWQYFHYRSEEARLDNEIAEVFQQTMPGAPVPDSAAARGQVESRLAQLRGTGAVSGMMTTLAMLGEALAQAQGTNIEALSYRNNTTDLRVLAPSVDALDRIRQVASERGVTATIESASPRDSKFEGRLKFQSSGP